MCLYPRNALSECSGSDHTKYTGEHSGVGWQVRQTGVGWCVQVWEVREDSNTASVRKMEDVHPLLCGLLSLVFITVRGTKKRVVGGPCLQVKGNQRQDPLTCCFIPSQLLTKYLNHTLPFSNYLQNEGRKAFTSTKSSWFHKLSLRRLIWYSKSYNGWFIHYFNKKKL